MVRNQRKLIRPDSAGKISDFAERWLRLLEMLLS